VEAHTGDQPDDAVIEFLHRSGLIASGETAEFEPLAGGVSSSIWIAHSPDRSFCIKKALPRLRVAAEWLAPVTRNAAEVRWLKAAARILPDAVPRVLAEDADLGVFAMEYLPPSSYESWKERLRHGVAEPETGALVGERLAKLHRSFAHSGTADREFANDATFYALRIEPYLIATARVHPDIAGILERLAEVTAATKRSVVHGDVSPKNILLGPNGPVFIDAECAWFGDPAFDLAFCLNHLLLKKVWVPAAEQDLLRTFASLTRAYLDGINWEPPRSLEERTAHLLPGLLLARIDGKSPVEYLNDEVSKDTVRRIARKLLTSPPDRLEDFAAVWHQKRSPSTVRRSPSIAQVRARRVWDSRGRPTVEAEIALDNGLTGRAIAPAGASVGVGEAIAIDVDRAIGNVKNEIAAALRGMPIADQDAIDDRLITLDGTPNKARLGGNATVAVSMAVLHAAAAAKREPLWRYIAGGAEPLLPMPMIQIFGGGAHADFALDIQDFLIIPVGASTFAEALLMTANVYRAAGGLMRDRGQLRGVADEGGWWPAFVSNAEALDTLVEAIERAEYRPGTDVGIAIDVAASQLRRGLSYDLRAENVTLDSGQLVERLSGWCDRYPIVSIEDPLAENDHDGMRAFTAKMGNRVQIVGDDYLVTSAARISAASSLGACNAVLLKPNQAGTVTETAAALTAARAAGWPAIVSARSGETEDVTIAHLAVGWGTGQLKVGSITRSERTAKWNEVLRIEEALGSSARFARDFGRR